MRKLLYIFLFAAVLSSCSNLLDEDPSSFYDGSTVYTTNAAIEASSTACYVGLRNTGTCFTFHAATDIFAAMAGQATGSTFTPVVYPADGGLDSSDSILATVWNAMYITIKDCNITIYRVGSSTADLDEDLRTRVIAEAKFIRALMYFDLVRTWNEVPLVTKMPTSNTDVNVAASSIAEIYDQILDDLFYAEEYLWDRGETRGDYTNNVGRATRLAAQSLLAKVYLEMASSSRYAYTDPDLDEGVVRNGIYKDAYGSMESSLYTEAKDWATKAINNSDFVWVEDWTSLWGAENDNNREMIFATQYMAASGYGTNIPTFTTPEYSTLNTLQTSGKVAAGNNQTYVLFQAAPYNINVDFEPRVVNGMLMEFYDTRQPELIVWDDAECRYKYTSEHESNAGEYLNYSDGTYHSGDRNTYPYSSKYIDDTFSVASTSGIDYPRIRAAELYLIRAEAIAEITNNPSLAYDDYNMVRRRGNPLNIFSEEELSTYPGDFDKDRFIYAIVRERVAEFSLEGKFWFDFKRLGVLSYITTQVSYTTFYRDQAKYYYWPYPAAELSANKALSQKVGYN